MDLGAVKEAPPQALMCGAAAAARNARSLLEDAETLSGAGRLARAYSLAGLAVEEVGKADGLAALAAMPESLRSQAPVGRLLEWHQMKLVTGQLITGLSANMPTICARLINMPLGELDKTLDNAQAFAENADRLKQRGLYVDFDRRGQVREPSEVTADEVREQLDQARLATSAVIALIDPSSPLLSAHPRSDQVELSHAVFSAFREVGHARSPEAAADVLRSTVTRIR